MLSAAHSLGRVWRSPKKSSAEITYRQNIKDDELWNTTKKHHLIVFDDLNESKINRMEDEQRAQEYEYEYDARGEKSTRINRFGMP